MIIQLHIKLDDSFTFSNGLVIPHGVDVPIRPCDTKYMNIQEIISASLTFEFEDFSGVRHRADADGGVNKLLRLWDLLKGFDI